MRAKRYDALLKRTAAVQSMTWQQATFSGDLAIQDIARYFGYSSLAHA